MIAPLASFIARTLSRHGHARRAKHQHARMIETTRRIREEMGMPEDRRLRA